MYHQLYRGRDEPVLDPGLPIIDAQHHLFVRPGIRYLLDDYLTDAASGHHIVASVYVEARSFYRTDGPELLRPLGEVEFANGAGAMAASGTLGPQRAAAAIVAYADLRHGDRIAAYLDQALNRAPDRLRGIRQGTPHHPTRDLPGTAPPGILTDPGFRAGFRHLAPRRLSFDAAVFHHQLPELAALADAFPTSTIILNHSGTAFAIDENDVDRRTVFRQWRTDLHQLAQRPNVLCKISGLGLPFWGFGFENRTTTIGYQELATAWTPYVETAIDAFGPHRCMMASDYPADSQSAGFVPLWNALKHITRNASSEEKAALFHSTASRTYRLPPGTITPSI